MNAEHGELDGRIRKVLAHALQVSEGEIGDESRFIEDFGGDSMTTLEILSELEREFEITVPEENLPRLVNLTASRGVLLEIMGAQRTRA